MNILGISHPISWNSAACAVVDGELRFFLEEERAIRFKHAPHVFPSRSAEMARTVLPDQFDIAVGFQFVDPDSIRDTVFSTEKFFRDEEKILRAAGGQADIFRRFDGRRVVFVDHQESHAYSVIAQNRFQPGLVISMDGWGGKHAGLIARWDGESLSRLGVIPPSHSLGVFYSHFTVLCGFRYHSGEGSLMGLAALGKSPRELPERIFDQETLLPERAALQQFFRELEAPQNDEERADWALTAQRYFERAVLRLVERYLEPGDETIMLAGGCALNCTANGMLATQFPDRRIVVQPASADSGTAFGAAVSLGLNHGIRVPFEHAYLGREVRVDPDIVPGFLKSNPFDADEIVERLTAGDVVGICHGRDEVGPRALCNRSLLAGGQSPTTREKLNKVKRRQWWRPVAPVTTGSLVGKCLAAPLNADLRFMNVAAQASDTLKDVAPTCVHFDGSIRVQVLEDGHPLHPVIEAYHAETECPVLANTSFNIGVEPIVHTFEDALRTFLFDDRIAAMVADDTLYSK